jgi:hypothetical protein
MPMCRVGQNHIYTYVRCTYVILSREITIHKVIYGVHIRFWPTLPMCVPSATTSALCVHVYTHRTQELACDRTYALPNTFIQEHC